MLFRFFELPSLSLGRRVTDPRSHSRPNSISEIRYVLLKAPSLPSIQPGPRIGCTGLWPHSLLLLLLCCVATLTLTIVVSSRRENLLSTSRRWPWWWRRRNIWCKLLLAERLPRKLILLVLILREVLLRWRRRVRLTVFAASKGAWIIVTLEVQRWLWTLVAEGVISWRGSLLIVPTWLRCPI